LARTKQTGRSPKPQNGSPSVESVLATVRAVWTTAEGASGAEKAKLKKDIIQTVSRLKARIEGRLDKPVVSAEKEALLFDQHDDQPISLETAVVTPAPPRFTEPILRIYDKDFANHVLQHLPQAVKFNTVEGFRNYLADKIRFNSQAIRRRAASYIVSRFFPGDVYHADVPLFAAATAGQPALGEALFYLACRTERILSLVAEDVVFPSLAQGGVSRTRIREYVQAKLPKSKSAEAIGQSIVRSYQFYGIGIPNRTRLNVSLREGCLASFAYVLHLEFSEPGMHAFEKMFEGPMHKWLLWDQQWMISQLYRLREVGLLSKVSEIDRMRQFTTKFSLAEAMQRIVALAKESPQ